MVHNGTSLAKSGVALFNEEQVDNRRTYLNLIDIGSLGSSTEKGRYDKAILYMNSNLERPERGFASLAEQFKEALTKKAEEEIKQLLQVKVEEYYQQHINHQELSGAVERLFKMLLQGKSEPEIEKELSSLAMEVVKKSG